MIKNSFLYPSRKIKSLPRENHTGFSSLHRNLECQKISEVSSLQPPSVFFRLLTLLRFSMVIKPCALTSQGSPEKQANKMWVWVGLGTPNTVTCLRVPW